VDSSICLKETGITRLNGLSAEPKYVHNERTTTALSLGAQDPVGVQPASYGFVGWGTVMVAQRDALHSGRVGQPRGELTVGVCGHAGFSHWVESGAAGGSVMVLVQSVSGVAGPVQDDIRGAHGGGGPI